jgi:hypothetical protein
VAKRVRGEQKTAALNVTPQRMRERKETLRRTKQPRESKGGPETRRVDGSTTQAVQRHAEATEHDCGAELQRGGQRG